MLFSKDKNINKAPSAAAAVLACLLLGVSSSHAVNFSFWFDAANVCMGKANDQLSYYRDQVQGWPYVKVTKFSDSFINSACAGADIGFARIGYLYTNLWNSMPTTRFL